MHQNEKDRLCKFALPIINKYMGTSLQYEGRLQRVAGLIAHIDGTRTVILESDIGEDFIPYQEYLSLIYPDNRKSYQKVPSLKHYQ